ncbi:MAG: DMT family transporter [Pseudobdellovibrio sp.]
MNLKLILLTALTMIAFAANSILCRLALVNPENAPMSFTIVRLAAGALVLLFFFFKLRKAETFQLNRKTFLGPAMLFSYAIFFSLAYVQITAGTGALILFACVQITMMVAAFIKKQILSPKQKIGFTLAFCGLVYLLLPGLNAPPMQAALLMTIAGISWGVYSLNGQGAKNPVLATARNFVLTLPVVIVLAFIYPLQLTAEGWKLAVLSGAITSGLGYVLWYAVLKDLVTSTAAIVQLSVPAVAAFGGVLFLGEDVHFRLVVASLLIIGGIIIKILN